ncbi:MAG: VWA-like domain-containing protein [Lachnospiraceae bacterium]|nr:VWA-like domain-containing protein [Lachnospiraceae bacterium]
MDLSEEKKKKYMKRLLLARMRILSTNGFYGLLIMHMNFALDENCNTASTDGNKFYFGPSFLDEISDSELDFILMHEILHVALLHPGRRDKRDPDRYNIACDIVVNSNILKSFDMDERRISLKEYGVSMHTAPDNKEGYNYTAEQVYQMLEEQGGNNFQGGKSTQDRFDEEKQGDQGNDDPTDDNKDDKAKTWDDHSKWSAMERDEFLQDEWLKHLEDVCAAIEIRDPSNTRGMLPVFAQRIINDLRKPQTDWRTILNCFVQEEITDYSFMPPDRRMDDSDFYLPDYNEKEDALSDILFMVDTSGSVSDEMIAVVYTEIKGAIDQFGGALKGWLGFFDSYVTEPVEFSNELELLKIKPRGGGGTDFSIIFSYVRKHMKDRLPASIIILTDGYAPIPPESAAMSIPVLWLINNDVVTPKWGKVARISV